MRILSGIKTKLLTLCLLISLVLLNFTGCFELLDDSSLRYVEDRQTYLPNTAWATENGEISFRVEKALTMVHKGTWVNEHGDPVYEYTLVDVFGEINKGEEKYDVFMKFGVSPCMNVISSDIPKVGEYGKYYEEVEKYTLIRFAISDIEDNHFKVNVTQSSIYDEGTVFDFYRQE